MCGIAGIVTRGAPPDEGLLRRMSQAIAHRGPDGEGVWISPGVGLAHRRLAIIDLQETGSQPMHTLDKTLTIVFNGEVYNYRELRVELELRGAHFFSNSDTEVILEAYRAWGMECLSKLRGMFAFALWDEPRKRLVLTRDRIGKKPLFYGFTPTYDLVFASELKALAPVLSLKPDWDAIRLFLGLQYVPSPRTGFHEVMQLEPGEFGIWDHDGWKLGRYAQTTEIEHLKSACSVQEIDEKIRQLLEESVRLRMTSADVPVGAFLSGGVDSTAIVAYASRYSAHPLQTFTMGFADAKFDERSEAEHIAQLFKTQHTAFEAKPEDLRMLIDELVEHYDAPFADSSALPLWLLARETAKHIKVVLTGDGGDELFGGYRRYAMFERAKSLSRIPGMITASTVGARVISNTNVTRFLDTVSGGYGELFCGAYFGSRAVRDFATVDFLKQTDASDAVKFVTRKMNNDALSFDVHSYLPDDLNVKMDRATMRWGLEARAPLLDQELVAFAQTIPMNQKVHAGKTKLAFKRALRGIVPDDVLRRPKRGFQVPLAEWFRGPLRPMVKDRLLDPQSAIGRIIRRDALERLIAENNRGMDHGNRLWMILSLSKWLSMYDS